MNYNSFEKKDIKEIFIKYLCQIIPVVDKNFNLKDVVTLEQFLKKNLKTTNLNEKFQQFT